MVSFSLFVQKKNGPWLSVPQFGHWDQKGVYPDYSMDFSKIRENRKQNKKDLSRASFGNENDLIFSTKSDANENDHHYHQNQSTTVRFITIFFFVLVRSIDHAFKL